MNPSFTYGTLDSSHEEENLSRLLSQCFNSPGESVYMKRVGSQNFRVLRQGDQLVGGLAVLQMGQWYGGQCVPMAGIAAVGVAPEFRGSGAAITLMQKTLGELREQGIPLSVLYPATQRLYRKAGYEQGGLLCVWEIEPQTIQASDRSLPIHPITPTVDLLAPLYRQKAQIYSGHVERHSFLWQELTDMQPKEAIACAYGFGDLNHLEGYIIFHQVRVNNDNRLVIKDWVLLTSAAIQRFWSFLADHRSQIDNIRWRSSLTDPLSLLLPEQSARLVNAERWMLRIIDVSKALEKRGYSANVQAELHLDIQDDLFAENTGRFVLTVANGKSEVVQGGNGDLKLHIRSLSSLYSGLFTARELKLMGQIEGTEIALSTADHVFQSHSPWLSDFF
ncbi:GNAT family N-acetyltransferase [Oscillatoria sp. FACHB-1407]|uniref:GNAT family N-acetyltransferase n=1 Tax=Oscillatoria sp. FACHB-1407 TaxID=2692847 RepID=UPI0016820603|nr:GNAT family N-acetyltransferase [Oscillatoria sp. FACHB-1407]MBD2465326.1 GNAT family N-acetyltransferase [Oscillatoria sp. FACHB-1407]